MRLSTGSKNANQKQNILNVPVRVMEFVEKNGQVGVKGQNLLSGEDITVFLTTIGKNAENESRPTIAVLREEEGLDVGGLMSFRQCWQPKGSSHHISAWPNMMARNKEDAKAKLGHSRAAMLQLGEKDGKPYGTMYTFLDNPKLHIRGANSGAIKEGVAQITSKLRKPSFLIRIIDDNKQVVTYNLFNKQWNTEAGRRMDGNEIASVLAQTVDKLQEKVSGTVDIVPADRFTVTTKGLSGKKSRFSHFAALQKSYLEEDTNGDVELFCKDTYFRVGGVDNTFVNDLYPIDPYGKGQDPALLGGHSYSPDFTEVQTYDPNEQESSEQGQGPVNEPIEQTPSNQSAAVMGADEDDPFSAIDGESFDAEEPFAPRG